MSLKAKLEAVIYAAEEPVTLTQLATLFSAEALEWKAAQEAASAQQAADTSVDQSQPLLGEGLEYLELRTEDGTLLDQPGFAVLPVAEQFDPADPEQAWEQMAETGTDNGDAAGVESAIETQGDSAPGGEIQADTEGEAKRLARQRDREVKAVLRQLLDELMSNYSSDDRGVEIREIAGGYRMATKPECHDAVRIFIKSLKPAMKLSLPALETLAVIAYKQPVTAPEVNDIRGVDSSGVFGSLLARKLITTAGRKQVIGRPILYKTTKEFLLRFGLKDVSELPSMDEFEKMASIELEESDAAEPTAPEPESDYEPGPDAGPELDEDAPEEPEAASSEATALASDVPSDARPAE